MTPQHMIALGLANQARVARADLRRRVRTNEQSVAAVVLTNPPEAQRMTVANLLACQHRWGSLRVRRFLFSISMSETRVVGDMTERERQAVASRLNGGLRAIREAA